MQVWDHCLWKKITCKKPCDLQVELRTQIITHGQSQSNSVYAEYAYSPVYFVCFMNGSVHEKAHDPSPIIETNTMLFEVCTYLQLHWSTNHYINVPVARAPCQGYDQGL